MVSVKPSASPTNRISERFSKNDLMALRITVESSATSTLMHMGVPLANRDG
jgi:hypothetical protein